MNYPTKNALKSWHQEYEQGHDLPAGYVRLRPKYSNKHKSMAVQYYLIHDRCLAATIKALGYPGCKTLADWIDELYPGRRRVVVGKGRSIPRPAQLKQAGVIELSTRQTSAQAVAEQLAASRWTLSDWKNQLLGREAPASMKRHNDPPPASELSELERQVESLRRDIGHCSLNATS